MRRTSDFLSEHLGVTPTSCTTWGVLAEWVFGAGRCCRNLVFLTRGRPILDGRLYPGAVGSAGEVGTWWLADDCPELRQDRLVESALQRLPAYRDERGVCTPWFSAEEFVAAVGHDSILRQANCSISGRSVLRGIHYADVPPSQATYVTCVRGR